MRAPIAFVLGLALIGGWACAPEESPAPSIEAALAFEQPPFDETVFDTITWSSEDALLARGQVVFETHCQKCHGITGAGEGGYIFGGQNLTPPSWLVADWRFAEQPIALRSYIYSGSVGGMPYWGLTGVSYRDIDAVASYIVHDLRPTYGEHPTGT